jgi:membrane associated rhomboid family serine protease
MTNRAFLSSLSFHNSAHQLAIALIAVSVVHGLLGTAGLLLIPAATLNNLEIWRPFTALLVAVNPVEIIFGALIIYSIGGALEQSWGKRRFLKVALGIPFLAELATLTTYALLPLNGLVAYHGASMIISTIWIAYGLRAAFTRQLLNFWGSPLRGETFALIGLGFVVLNAIFAGITVVLPDLFAAAFTYIYMYRRGSLNLSELRRKIELAYYNWKLKRLKKKTGFRVVKGSKDDSDSNTRYH